MRKILSILACGLTALLITSCKESTSAPEGTPAATAEKSMECIQKKDFKGFVDLLDFGNAESSEVEQQKTAFAGMLESKFKQQESEMGAIKDFKVLDEQIKDSTAVVKMLVNYEQKSDTSDVKLKLNNKGEWKLDMGK